MNKNKYPLILEPIYKERVWGGDKLLPGHVNIGESWVLSVRPDDDVVIKNGALAGMKLGDALSIHPEFLGSSVSEGDFPILIKFIDSVQALSIQVHPDDDTAMILGCERGKTELWYIVESAPESFIYYGIREDADINTVKKDMLSGKDVTGSLNKVYVNPGDCFLIEGGTPHAIGAGIYLAEIQQNCDTTFRIYDYGRLGLDGKPRELHLKEASVAIKNTPCKKERKGESLVSCKYFNSSMMSVSGDTVLYSLYDRFTSLTVISGHGVIRFGEFECDFAKGSQIFIPAGREEYLLSGEASIIKTIV
jgi:mannose-6-phosphate isomerase